MINCLVRYHCNHATNNLVTRVQVASELERSLPHGVRAFERVSRAIQRLCNGYASLPGLLEWGRANAARLQGGSGAGGSGDVGSLGDGYNGVAHGVRTSTDSDGGSGGCGGGGGGSDWQNYFLQREARAAPGGGDNGYTGHWAKGAQEPGVGGGYTELWAKGNRDRRRGRGGGSAEFGIPAVGGERSGSSSACCAVGSRGATSSRSPDDRKGLGAWSSSLTASLSSASTASLPERAAPVAPSWQSDPADSYYLPKMVRGGGRDLGIGGGTGDERRRLKTAGHIIGRGGGGGSGGILCSSDYGESAAGSTWEGGETTAARMSDGDGDLSSLGTLQDGTVMASPSSVASLLREERAFQRRSSALQW